MSDENKSKPFYKRPHFIVNLAIACFIALGTVIAFLNWRASVAAPEFKIAFGQGTRTHLIYRQEASPFVIFRPPADVYTQAHGPNKADCVTLTNVGKVPSDKTHVDIILADPFAISLVAVYMPGCGWLDTADRTVEAYDEQNHQTVTLTIADPIGKKEKLEVYLGLVYRTSMRERYTGQDKIDRALIIRVDSSGQKNTSLSTKSFDLYF